jgi:hypothetical protein
MKFQPINTDTFLRILDAVAWRNGSTIDEIAHFSGFGRSTVRNAVSNAAHFSLTKVANNGAGSVATISSEYIPKLSKSAQLEIVRAHLQRWTFFQLLCEFINHGESISDAIRKACAIASVHDADEAGLSPLLNLAIEVNLLRKESGRVSLAASITKAPTVEAGVLTAQLDGEMAAHLFVAQRLGSRLFHSLEKTEQDRLSKAVLKHASEPEKSCEDAGKALESFLRVVGTNAGHDLKGFNGLGEIADYLSGGGRMVIHPKHRDLIKATSTLRNCSAHERDKLTNVPWRKTPEMALTNVMWTLHLVRSVGAWVEKREQVL